MGGGKEEKVGAFPGAGLLLEVPLEGKGARKGY